MGSLHLTLHKQEQSIQQELYLPSTLYMFVHVCAFPPMCFERCYSKGSNKWFDIQTRLLPRTDVDVSIDQRTAELVFFPCPRRVRPTGFGSDWSMHVGCFIQALGVQDIQKDCSNFISMEMDGQIGPVSSKPWESKTFQRLFELNFSPVPWRPGCYPWSL